MSDRSDRLSAGAPREREASLQEVGATVWRHRWVVAGITAAIVLIVGAVSFAVRPIYESEAVVRIQTEDPRGGLLSSLGPLSALGSLSGFGQQELDTEMGVLRSRRLATEVADSLGLVVEVVKPRREAANLLQATPLARDTLKGTFTLRRGSDGAYALSPSLLTRLTGAPVNLPRSVRPGEPFRIGETQIVLNPSLGAGGPEVIRFQLRSHQRMLERMDRALKVATQESGSQLVEVRYRDRSPERAAAVVNGLVERYVTFKDETDRSRTRYTIDTLRVEVANYQEQLREAEERLRTFQERERIIAPEEEAIAQIERMAEVQAMRDQLGVERRAIAALLADVASADPAPDQPSPYRQLATFPSFITNGAVQNLLASLIDLENQRSGLLSRRTEENADVRALTVRIAELEDQLYRLAQNYLISLDTQLASVERSLAGFGAEIEQVPQRAIQYARLVRDTKLLNEIYLAVQGRLEEAAVEDAASPPEVQVIDFGLVPEDPVVPKPLVNLLLATILGLLVSVSVVVGREMVSSQIRSRADAEHAAAGLPVLGAVPAREPEAHLANGNGRRRVRIPWVAGRPGGAGPALIGAHSATGAEAQAYRSLFTHLELGLGEGGARVVTVTSPRGGHRSAEIVANLGVTAAQQGLRAIVIEVAAPRHGALHEIFDAPAAPGLDAVLAGSVALGEAVQAIPLPGVAGSLTLLPAGAGGAQATPVLNGARLGELLATLRERYDYILFDAPPLSASAEASVLGRVVDATLLLARNGVTTREELEAAALQLKRSGVAVAGIVLEEGVAVTGQWGPAALAASE